LVAEIVGKTGGSGGDVLGSRVLTDDGKDLGKVLDVIIEVTNDGRLGAVTGEAPASHRGSVAAAEGRLGKCHLSESSPTGSTAVGWRLAHWRRRS
jgi:hypothetical protein